METADGMLAMAVRLMQDVPVADFLRELADPLERLRPESSDN